jgi:magnesium-transporting ATPase (P-type)
MPFDPAHFVERFFSAFNPESRFYWPAVYSLLVALVANIVWYNWRTARVTPPENAAKPWAFWINVLFIIVLAVLFIAKAPFFLFVVVLAINAGLLVYMYTFLLPPQEAAWEREERRRAYFPQKKKRRR